MLAVVLVLAWTVARVHFTNGGNWTALFCTGSDTRLPSELDAGTYRVSGTGYDGQFYRLAAHDPFLRRNYARYVDAPQLRLRRALVPLAAWALALGQQGWIDGAYFAVELIFLGLGTYWCARLMVRRGCSPLWGLLFAILPATLASIDRMLVDGALAALFAGFWLYCEEERRGRVWMIAMLAALTRDTGLILAASLVGDRLWQRDWRGGARFACCLIPAAAWYGFLAVRPAPDGPTNIFGVPVWGLVRRLFFPRPYFNPVWQTMLRVSDALAVLGLIVCILLPLFWLRRRPLGPVAIAVVLFVCLALVLTSPAYLYEPFGFGRPASPLLLWVTMEAVARRKWLALAAPLAVSLGVGLAFVRPALEIGKALVGG